MTKPLRTWIRRIAKFLKWGVIVLAVLMVIDGVLCWVLASRNQTLIDNFLRDIHAESYWAFATAGVTQHDDGFTGNGWFLYLGALSTISRDVLEMEANGPDTYTAELKERREGELDVVHAILLEAEKLPYSIAITPDGRPPEAVLPPILHVLHYAEAAAASARDCFEADEPAAGAERLLDVLRMRHVVSGTPILISLLCSLSVLDRFVDAAAVNVQELPDEYLKSCIDKLEAIDLKMELTTGFRGEVLYILDRWNELLGGGVWKFMTRIPFNFRLGQSYLELDRSHTLEYWIPLALEPTIENSQELVEEIPFYAFITRSSYFDFGHFFNTVERNNAKRVVLLEGLRLEQGRREAGAWPEMRKEIDGIPLEIRETEERLEITSPRLQELTEDEKPFVLKLRR